MSNEKDVNIVEMAVQGRANEQLRNRQKRNTRRKRERALVQFTLDLLLRTGNLKGGPDERLHPSL